MLRLRPNYVAAAILLFALGCRADTENLRWEIAFASDALEARAVRVSAQLLEEDCSETAQTVYEIADIRANRAASEVAATLNDGTYGFGATAYDAQCLRYADGCIRRTLPIGSVTTDLEAVTPTGVCDGFQCNNGVCTEQACTCDTDVSPNGATDVDDLIVIGDCFESPIDSPSLEEGGTCVRADVDCSGTVDVCDFARAYAIFNGGMDCLGLVCGECDSAKPYGCCLPEDNCAACEITMGDGNLCVLSDEINCVNGFHGTHRPDMTCSEA